MKVLIVGSTSTLGLATGRLLSKKHTVSYAGRRNADYHLDLELPNLTFPKRLRFDVVIHVAADFGGEKEEEILRAEIVNVIGTLNVCRLSKQAGAQHLIVISSASADYMHGDLYFNGYSLSKRHADELALFYCNKFDLPLTILRPTQIYDAESKYKTLQRLFYLIIERALNSEDIHFYGNNDALRNYIFIDDVAEIICRVVEKKVTGHYYCSANKSIKLSELGSLAYNVFNTKGNINFIVDKTAIPDLKSFSGQELYKKIGYHPRVNLTEGIQKIKQSRERSCEPF